MLHEPMSSHLRPFDRPGVGVFSQMPSKSQPAAHEKHQATLTKSDKVQQPCALGWFNPNDDYAQFAIQYINQLSRDELLEEFWKTDPFRCRYGELPDKLKPSRGRNDAFSFSHSFPKKMEGFRDWRHMNHTTTERDRRDYHRKLQSYSHTQTCELANKLAELHSVPQKHNRDLLKRPTKSDQLLSSLYMQLLSAIVVQSEHKERIAAERRVRQLEQELLQHKEHANTFTTYGVKRDAPDSDHLNGADNHAHRSKG